VRVLRCTAIGPVLFASLFFVLIILMLGTGKNGAWCFVSVFVLMCNIYRISDQLANRTEQTKGQKEQLIGVAAAPKSPLLAMVSAGARIISPIRTSE